MQGKSRQVIFVTKELKDISDMNEGKQMHCAGSANPNHQHFANKSILLNPQLSVSLG